MGSEWKPLAERGNAQAQILIGSLYRFGQGVPQDYAEALEWIRKAAEQGDAGGQFGLGVMHAKGLGYVVTLPVKDDARRENLPVIFGGIGGISGAPLVM